MKKLFIRIKHDAKLWIFCFILYSFPFIHLLTLQIPLLILLLLPFPPGGGVGRGGCDDGY